MSFINLIRIRFITKIHSTYDLGAAVAANGRADIPNVNAALINVDATDLTKPEFLNLCTKCAKPAKVMK